MSKFVVDISSKRPFKKSRLKQNLFLVIKIALFSLITWTLVELLKSSQRESIHQKHLRQLQKWADNERSRNTTATCRNTMQGKQFVTDDRGFVCDRRVVNTTSGCCGKPSWKHHCAKCDMENHCCTAYEYCVSCCLGSEKSILEASMDTKSIYENIDNTFDLCRMLCRTSSKSVVHENAYRSNLKHCFGTNSPPLKVS